jgi:effector-binding domain-containing protein
MTVARTVLHGNCDGLAAAWGELGAWVDGQGRRSANDFWEVYSKGPESSSDPADWRTQLNRPLLEGAA